MRDVAPSALSASPTPDVSSLDELVHSWRTFLCETPCEGPAVSLSAVLDPLAGLHLCRGGSTHVVSEEAAFLEDEVLPFHLARGTDGEAGATWAEPPSALWLLSLATHHPGLLRSVARLFVESQTQYAALREAEEAVVTRLRHRHQREFASLLRLTDGATEVILPSSVTQRIVQRHQAELEAQLEAGAAEARSMEATLRDHLFRFLSAVVSDAVAPRQPVVARDASSGGLDEPPAEVHVSRFAAGVVPVRTLLLQTPRRGHVDGEPDGAPASSPIVLDLSPSSALAGCLGGLAAASTEAVEVHVSRLAGARHALLLLVGDEAAARVLLQTARVPELLLDAPHGRLDEFAPLRAHPGLRLAVNTRLWGANLVLLWTPTATEGRSGASFMPPPTVVEDALRLGMWWNVDMFSVALLEGYCARSLASSTPMDAQGPRKPLDSYQLCAEVLRHLQCGLTTMVAKSSNARGPPLWLEMDKHQPGLLAAPKVASPRFPRSVGRQFMEERAVEGSPTPIRGSVASGRWSWWSLGGSRGTVARGKDEEERDHSRAGGPGGHLETKGSTSPRRDASLAFNTVMSIRVFLPFPESCFLEERSKGGQSLGDGAMGNVPALHHPGSSESVCGPGVSPESPVEASSSWPYGDLNPDAYRRLTGSDPEQPTVQDLLACAFGEAAVLY